MKTSILAPLVLAVLPVLGRAGSAPVPALPPTPPAGWSFQADATFATKYMAHGYNFGGDDEPSFQPSLVVTTPQKWLAFKAWAAYPFDRDFDNTDELDFLLLVSHTFFADRPWALDLHGYADYWLLPDSNVVVGDRDEELRGGKFNFGFSFPKCLTLGPVEVVPGYNLYHWIPEKGGTFDDGSVHEFTLGFATQSPCPWDADRPIPWKAHAMAGYNDGAFGSSPGWSHCTVGLTAALPLGSVFSLTPGLFYQWSLESTVDPEDEFWASLSLTATF